MRAAFRTNVGIGGDSSGSIRGNKQKMRADTLNLLYGMDDELDILIAVFAAG